MKEAKNNESKLKAAGLRMALKLLPTDVLNAAPAKLEEYLKERLAQVEPETDEAGACYLIAPQADGSLAVLTVTLDEQNTVRRVVSQTTIGEIFGAILNNMKEL